MSTVNNVQLTRTGSPTTLNETSLIRVEDVHAAYANVTIRNFLISGTSVADGKESNTAIEFYNTRETVYDTATSVTGTITYSLSAQPVPIRRLMRRYKTVTALLTFVNDTQSPLTAPTMTLNGNSQSLTTLLSTTLNMDSLHTAAYVNIDGKALANIVPSFTKTSIAGGTTVQTLTTLPGKWNLVTSYDFDIITVVDNNGGTANGYNIIPNVLKNDMVILLQKANPTKAGNLPWGGQLTFGGTASYSIYLNRVSVQSSGGAEGGTNEAIIGITADGDLYAYPNQYASGSSTLANGTSVIHLRFAGA